MNAFHGNVAHALPASPHGPAREPAGVTLRGVSKAFGKKLAVAGLDLDIVPGEFLALLGPSGCGKSTTLRLIAGLEDATEGEILIDGRRVDGIPAKDRNVAMVFQHYALYPHLTVFRNLAMPLELRRLPRDEVERRVEAAAEQLDIAYLLNRKPSLLSGGQRQRVALARALVREPTLFLFDEPLSNLDAKLRAELRMEIRRLHREVGATSIYVTHDQSEAMLLADRIAVLDGGVLQQVGTPEELCGRPANSFVASFFGSPQAVRHVVAGVAR
jgi:multiple sugar transport system ATP-binding protein